jgi:hypothetical protein
MPPLAPEASISAPSMVTLVPVMLIAPPSPAAPVALTLPKICTVPWLEPIRIEPPCAPLAAIVAPGASLTALTPAIAMGPPDVVQLPASAIEPARSDMPAVPITLVAVSVSAPDAIKVKTPLGALTPPEMVMELVASSVSALADIHVSKVPGASLMLPASSVTLPAASMASRAVTLMIKIPSEIRVGAVSLTMMIRGSSEVMFAEAWFSRAADRV